MALTMFDVASGDHVDDDDDDDGKDWCDVKQSSSFVVDVSTSFCFVF